MRFCASSYQANDPGPTDHWDAINLGKRSLSMYEKIDRLHERKNVDDMAASKLPDRLELPQEVEEEAEGNDIEVMDSKAEADEVEKEDENDSMED
jgi:hypothetical protein